MPFWALHYYFDLSFWIWGMFDLPSHGLDKGCSNGITILLFVVPPIPPMAGVLTEYSLMGTGSTLQIDILLAWLIFTRLCFLLASMPYWFSRRDGLFTQLNDPWVHNSVVHLCIILLWPVIVLSNLRCPAVEFKLINLWSYESLESMRWHLFWVFHCECWYWVFTFWKSGVGVSLF